MRHPSWDRDDEHRESARRRPERSHEGWDSYAGPYPTPGVDVPGNPRGFLSSEPEHDPRWSSSSASYWQRPTSSYYPTAGGVPTSWSPPSYWQAPGHWNPPSHWSPPGSLRGEAERSRQSSGRFRGVGPKGYRRSDERIREDVCDCLMEDGEVDASDFEVTVTDGEVTLSGTVADRRQKRYVEELCERCCGVVDIHNNLRVKSRTPSAAEAEA